MTDHDAEFSQFFADVWGTPPHKWQTRLAAQVLNDERWPDVIDLPTGAGKTSVLDIAVYALSVRPDVFARRIAFVIDRRLIVDQTATRAAELAAALEARRTPAIAAVTDRLAALGSRGIALDVDRLRGGGDGGVYGSHWLKWPDQPAVIVSTVDQFGSRLLFRGYGVSPRMRPIHAGLTGNDCLVLLDEVHLSTALAETLHDLEAELSPVRGVPVRRQFVQMSATPTGEVRSRFTLLAAEMTDGSELAKRVTADKIGRLVRVGKPKQSAEAAWVGSINDIVAQLGLSQGVVGIVVNRVATARALGEALGTPMVLTGRMRPYERQEVERRAVELACPDRPDSGAGVAYIVATQCVEVGADLSFDAMITEICPLASLRQRFGRLDRRGRQAASGAPARALIIGLESQLTSQVDDPVYGAALHATWDALHDRFGDASFNVGPLSADLGGFDGSVQVPTIAPAVLMPSHLDLLSFTNPEPQCAPRVDQFLHGFRDDDADVSIVWRHDVDGDDREMSQAALDLMPPLIGEAVSIPIAAARRWLAEMTAAEVADVDSFIASDEELPKGRSVWRWSAGEQLVLVHAADVRVGDLLVVPSSFGGLSGGVWNPMSKDPVRDVAGPVAAAAGRPVVRIGYDVLEGWSTPTGDVNDESLAAVMAAVKSALAEGPDWGRSLDSERLLSYGPTGRLRWAVAAPRKSVSVTFDGSDDANSFVGRRVTLRSHLEGVGAHAQRFGENCGLPSALCADLRLAGEVHDVGKADRRFQLMLEGDEIEAAMAAEPIAKSRHHRRGWRGGYPNGMRHEFLSTQMLASAESMLATANDAELVMHLVTTHHGYARPVAAVVEDPAPQTVQHDVGDVTMTASSALTGDAVGAASLARFGRLTQRYGWHGLAWLEAMFRLADHRQSELEAQQ